MEPQRRNSCRKAGALTPGAQPCALPRPTFLRQREFSKLPKREEDGREGAISGRLARKATGVSPSGFARTGVLAGEEGFQFPRTLLDSVTIAPGESFPRRRFGVETLRSPPLPLVVPPLRLLCVFVENGSAFYRGEAFRLRL